MCRAAIFVNKKFNGEIYLLHMLDLPLQLIDPVGGSSQNVPEAIFLMKLKPVLNLEIDPRITIHNLPLSPIA